MTVVAALAALPALANNPIGVVDEILWDTSQSPNLVIRGWTLDPNTSASIDVHLYVNGSYLTAATANVYRPDVGAAYPGYGDSHGFHVRIDWPVGNGQVCVYAINTGPGDSNPLLGCKTALAGYTGCTWGSLDCNLCVNDVVSTFNNMRDHGEVLGFNPPVSGSFNVAYPSSNHWEGIQRLTAGFGRYLVVSKRDDRGANGNVAHTVYMGSRTTTGRRFRSNRLSTSINEPEDTTPLVLDYAAAALPLDDGYAHGGGMQAIGNIVALPMEEGPGNGKVVLYDFSSPTAPVKLSTVEGASTAAGTASLTKLADGRFMLVLGQWDAKTLEFFLSTGTNILTTGWEPYDVWQDTEVPSGHWGSFQNLNFITDCSNGQLFMIGTLIGGLGWGAFDEDFAHLYSVSLAGSVTFQHVASKHFYCSNDGARQCNFGAAGGAFVDRDHNLLLYVAEQADDGPGGSVKMIEYRGIFPNAACGDDINQAFVDFYDDSDFSDRGFIYDYPDRFSKNWANFGSVDGLNDKISSVRFCIPPGHRVRLYENSNFGGASKELTGTGSINLHDISFGDKISSAEWLSF
ncbi:hypothetical protein [Hyalangium versicolor]|uniref:hypothetical protein n=1 Tax=Hyalangium versicolor TaxID=2861190 RepID=UPI001CCCF97D|nr:hypothetical protein [Hyalangium versicolor]